MGELGQGRHFNFIPNFCFGLGTGKEADNFPENINFYRKIRHRMGWEAGISVVHNGDILGYRTKNKQTFFDKKIIQFWGNNTKTVKSDENQG